MKWEQIGSIFIICKPIDIQFVPHYQRSEGTDEKRNKRRLNLGLNMWRQSADRGVFRGTRNARIRWGTLRWAHTRGGCRVQGAHVQRTYFRALNVKKLAYTMIPRELFWFWGNTNKRADEFIFWRWKTRWKGEIDKEEVTEILQPRKLLGEEVFLMKGRMVRRLYRCYIVTENAIYTKIP